MVREARVSWDASGFQQASSFYHNSADELLHEDKWELDLFEEPMAAESESKTNKTNPKPKSDQRRHLADADWMKTLPTAPTKSEQNRPKTNKKV